MKKGEDDCENNSVLKWKLLKYFTILCLILSSVPVMRHFLYKPSFDLIRWISQFHTEDRTKFMNVIQFIGDGELYFYVNVLNFILGRDYEFYFLLIAYATNMHYILWLKTHIRDSRPQFDDPTLGVIEDEKATCSGEFGNPSGHS